MGSPHPPQQATNEISFLLAEGEAVKRWGCLEESERLLLYTNPPSTGDTNTMMLSERAALAPCHWGQGQ